VRFPADGFEMTVTIRSLPDSDRSPPHKYKVLSKGNENTIVMVTEPASERGQIMLMKGRDLWLFLPSVSEPVRLSLAQRLVGQVANGDIARTDYSADYDATLSGEESLGPIACHVLALKAKTKDVTYASIRYWVSKDARRPAQAEFYAGTGTLLKTGTFENFKDIGGQMLATRLTLVDAIRKDRRSVLDYGEITIRELPDRYFDKNYMKSLD